MKGRYLELTKLGDALALLREKFSFIPEIISIPISKSAGRVCARAVYAPLSIPSWHLSAMDGLAVRSTDTIGATEQNPILLTDFVRVNTGNLVPSGYDAVIMIEDVEEKEEGYQIRCAAFPWQHVRPVGEDIASTEMVIPAGHLIRSQDIGAITSYGLSVIDVLTLKVALIPTGSEIVPVGSTPKPGQVIESNMIMAASLIQETGAEVTIYPIIPDDPDTIRSTLEDAASNHDIVLVSAGSSKGTRDYTADCIRDLGEVFVHGIAIKPAKPVILGSINEKPVIGMPGYPVACYTILREIITPIVSWYGLPIKKPEIVQAALTNTLFSEAGTDEFVLMTVGKVNNRWVATPQSRGSGVQMSMVRSNGCCTIPLRVEGYEAGNQVEVALTVPKEEAEKTILIVGSHDPVIDRLSDLLREEGIFPSSVHVGSMGGILALKRESCHLAPMHLLSDDGDYNIQYLLKYLSGEDLVLICVAEREQGIVSANNLSFEAITTSRYINRQKGSGTRMLLDFLLKKHGIDPEQISGYEREVTTHLSVCLAVQSGDADMGMAVHTAAKTFGLNFVPVGTERYELVTTAEIFENDPHVQALFSMIQTDKFKNILESMGGYRAGETGVIRKITNQTVIQ